MSTQILQSILDLLHAAGKTERSELNAYAYAVLDSCSEKFYGGVRKHAQTVYTRPSPFFWEGPGYEAKMQATSKLRSPLPSPDRPLLRMRGCYLSVDAAMPTIITMIIQYFYSIFLSL